MDWTKILNTEREVKLILDLKDMVSLVDYILQNRFKTPELATLNQEFGGIELAMQVTGLARSTIYNKCNKGDFPHYKKGKLYFLKSELENYMKSKNFKNDDIDITKYLK